MTAASFAGAGKDAGDGAPGDPKSPAHAVASTSWRTLSKRRSKAASVSPGRGVMGSLYSLECTHAQVGDWSARYALVFYRDYSPPWARCG